MQQAYEGPPAGTGAVYTWAGNHEVGQGRMTVVESRPSDLIRIRLEFVKPFRTTHAAEFTFKPEGGQTTVAWTMFGRNDFVGKTVGLVMDMETMIGGQFEKGLARMKAVVEGGPRP